MKEPCVYILASRPRGTLYTGVTSDLYGRMNEHVQSLISGFTKKHGIKLLVYYEMHQSMDVAIAREKFLKKWHRAWKYRLIETMNPNWVNLFNIETNTISIGPADAARGFEPFEK
jgi:putative endonuclease